MLTEKEKCIDTDIFNSDVQYFHSNSFKKPLKMIHKFDEQGFEDQKSDIMDNFIVNKV